LEGENEVVASAPKVPRQSNSKELCKGKRKKYWSHKLNRKKSVGKKKEKISWQEDWSRDLKKVF